MRDAGGLEYDQFARRDCLVDFDDVVFDRFRQGASHQPDSSEGTAIEQGATAFSPAASNAAANKVVSRQVAIESWAILLGPRTFWPRDSKLTGG
jgi:hypothetical protein